MVEITEEQPAEKPTDVKEMKLEEILNDIYKKIDHLQATMGYIIEKCNLIPKENKIIE